MKRKDILILLTLVNFCLLLVLTSCGLRETKATIVDNQGEKIELSAKELKEVYETNEAKFERVYKGANISFEGTVKSVEADCTEYGSGIALDRIVFEEGWKVSLAHGTNTEFLEDLEKGTKVRVKSNINSCFGIDIDIRGMNEDGSYSRKSLEKTEIELAE